MIRYNRGRISVPEIIATEAFSPNSEAAYEHTNYTTFQSSYATARFFGNPLLFRRVGGSFCDFAIAGGQPFTPESSCRDEQDRAVGA